jgi:hypothetical protein
MSRFEKTLRRLFQYYRDVQTDRRLQAIAKDSAIRCGLNRPDPDELYDDVLNSSKDDVLNSSKDDVLECTAEDTRHDDKKNENQM